MLFSNPISHASSHYVQLFRRSSLFASLMLLCGRSYPDRNILLLLVGRRVGADGRVLAVGELGVGLEGLLGLVCDACVSRHCFIE